jgi:YidC/Oxa1 family membrane protein insertase
VGTILSPLYTVVSWIIVQFHSLYSLIFAADSGLAWGLSIVSLVVLIRICLIPLFVKQIHATRNMQVLQPKMKAIQERYKSDKQRQSEEMMKLYKESGTNPLSSCLPIIAQSPFFMSLYGVLSNIAKGQPVGVVKGALLSSAQHAHIFGAPLAVKFTDGAAKVTSLGASVTNVRVVTVIMILLMSASQFYTQRQLMTKNVDMSVKTPFMQQQKMLMYVFPVMFAVFGINFPVGVLVYWLTTNVWTMGQQMYVIRRNPTPGSLAYKERQERLRAKGNLIDEAKGNKEAVAGTVTQQSAKRQQPKRQTKSQRQAGGAQGPGKPAGGSTTALDTSADRSQTSSGTAADTVSETVPETVSEMADGSEKVDGAGGQRQRASRQDDEPCGAAGAGSAKGGQAPQQKSRQGKGQPRPKHPSKK